jgi:3-oxoacyl-[acyl-carrier protein] reductase
LASEGAKVVVNYFDNPEDAKETLKMIQENGGEAIIAQGDMTKAEEVKNYLLPVLLRLEIELTF